MAQITQKTRKVNGGAPPPLVLLPAQAIVPDWAKTPQQKEFPQIDECSTPGPHTPRATKDSARVRQSSPGVPTKRKASHTQRNLECDDSRPSKRPKLDLEHLHLPKIVSTATEALAWQAAFEDRVDDTIIALEAKMGEYMPRFDFPLTEEAMIEEAERVQAVYQGDRITTSIFRLGGEHSVMRWLDANDTARCPGYQTFGPYFESECGFFDSSDEMPASPFTILKRANGRSNM